MRNFDAPTLVVVDAYVLALLGALLLVSAFQGQREQALLYTACGALLSAFGLILSLLRSDPDLAAIVVVISNAVLIFAHAMIWAAFRAFSRQRQRPAWMLAGSLAWVALSLWPLFQQSSALRIGMYSILCDVYLGLALREAWRLRRQGVAGVLPAVVVLGLQMLFYLYRLLVERVPPILGADQSGFALTMFESILFAVSLSFVILMMVRARAERQYRHAALHDDLTGLSNRRAFFAQATGALAKARARRRDAVLLMCDLDWFKRINDACGHVAGDRVLVVFGDVLRESIRPGDLCARIGGEEFVVLALKADLEQGRTLGERIRGRLGAHSTDTLGRLSVSIGIASAAQADYELDRLLVRADEALYGAKAAGRDCVVAWPAAAAALGYPP
ncbi:GGDEF domain-containing protein [Castellaniella sp. S9]|uniref:GGDEF domain-containing protein n=1 Tax=Castellaniella sp. S9 TaxID=2993652 RepID=UPI0022B3F602|nr:GGDEF domain-containing protein [Castellaniella sp. S9]